MASKRQHTPSSSLNNHENVFPKRCNYPCTVLEHLPPELFVEIFCYLSDVDVVYTFSQLNDRFQDLIHHDCNTFDFKSVDKTKFKLILEQYKGQQWQALRLYNDHDTPGQVQFFFQQHSFAQHVSQLKALSLMSMTPEYAQLLMSQFQPFTHLISLTIGNVCGKTISSLELPSLQFLVVTSCKYSQWIKNLGQLKSLEYIIEHNCLHEYSLVWPTNLKRLKIFYTPLDDNEIVYASLCQVPQLNNLALYESACSSSPPDGQKWEKLIVSSLPLLKNFQFCFKFWKDSPLIGDISRIVSTFSTPFYLEEKRWFIQCDAHHEQFGAALLYSLPFAFERFEVVTHSFDHSLSTSSVYCTKNKKIYEHVKTLVVDVNCENLHRDLLDRSVEHLILKCAVTPTDWLCSMTQLRQLSLSNQLDMSSEDFARLLDTTPCLNSLNASYNMLNFLTNSWKNTTVCDQLSAKIRSLNLCYNEYLPPHSQNYVEEHELIPLVHVFSQRCHHLTICIHSRNIVSDPILRAMTHLRSLNVCLKEHGNLKITNEWLEEQGITFENVDCFITMDNDQYTFWFDNRD